MMEFAEDEYAEVSDRGFRAGQMVSITRIIGIVSTPMIEELGITMKTFKIENMMAMPLPHRPNHCIVNLEGVRYMISEDDVELAE